MTPAGRVGEEIRETQAQGEGDGCTGRAQALCTFPEKARREAWPRGRKDRTSSGGGQREAEAGRGSTQKRGGEKPQETKQEGKMVSTPTDRARRGEAVGGWEGEGSWVTGRVSEVRA